MKGVVWAATIMAICNFGSLVNGVPFVSSKNKQIPDLKPFKLDDILNRKFTFKGFQGSWISDNEILIQSRGNLSALNVETTLLQTIITADVLEKYNGASPYISPDRKKVLFRYDTRSVFRHSTTAKCDVYDIETKVTTQLEDNSQLQLCVWSPTGDGVAYVYKNDVYYWDGQTSRLTNSGIEGVEYFGIPDWVYEEEVLADGGALWFAPDGKKLAIGQFDDKNVSTYSFPFYSNPSSKDEVFLYPEELQLKYPKAGTPNPKVYLNVKNLEDTNNQDWDNLPAPIATVSADHILQSVTWIDNRNILAIWMNRRQNIASIQKCDTEALPGVDKCKEVVKLEEPKGWVSIGNPKCSSVKNSCIFTYWIDNWFQIWNLDLSTGVNMKKAMGKYTVISLYGYKESSGDIFYLATKEGHPEQRHVYQNEECLSCSLVDPSGTPCTYASASFSKDYKYYALTCTGPTPAYTDVFETATKKKIIDWESNAETRKELESYLKPTIKFLNVPVTGGYHAMVKLMLPPEINFDSPDPKKKYAMIVSVYGGPNSVRVTDAFSVAWEKYLVTSRNIIYAFIDGRGSGYKGKDMLFEINNKMGSVEITDQIEVTQYLTKHYQFIDTERVGIWGWSYGGYVTALVIARDSERVFQCGISVAPVTSWIYYDSIYTERFMGLPTVNDNLVNYIEGDVTRNVELFKNHDFLLIHGTGDDNVHYQQALALAKALQNASILFEQVSYTDEDHSLGNVQPHLYHTMDQFWGNCLNLESEDD